MRALEHGRFGCGHCQSSFLYTGGRIARGPDREQVPSSGAALVVIVSIVLLVFGGAFFFVFASAGDVAVTTPTSRAETATVAEAPRPVVAATPRPAPTIAPPPPPTGIAVAEEPKLEEELEAPPQLSDYQTLNGCSCPKNAAQIMVSSTGRTTTISDAGMTITRHLDFAAVGADETPWRMPVTDTSAPAAHYDKGDISMGVGCKGDALVVAAGMHVSAWSLSKHTLLWSHTLDAPFGKYGAGEGGSMGIDCSALRLGKDAVSLRAGKRTVKLALADGAVR